MKTDRWMEGGRAYRIRSIAFLDCDMDDRLFPHWIMGEFSEIVGDPYLAVGESYQNSLDHGQIWVVARMSMRVHRMPRSEENIQMSLWYRGTDAEDKYLYHDFEIRSREGELLVSCAALHRALDLNRGCAILVSEMVGSHPEVISEKADAPDCKRIYPKEPLVPLGSRTMLYSDIDRNGHANNAVYTRIAQDFLPPEYRSRQLKEYFVNFVRSTELDDVLDIEGQATEQGYLIMGSCKGKVSFSSEFIFE